jgi:transketolase
MENQGIFSHVDFSAVNYPALAERSHWLRNALFEMSDSARLGHIPSSFSCAELVVSLYYGGILRYNARNPKDDRRDRFVVSKGHAGMVTYPILVERGFIPQKELQRFCKQDCVLRMYPDPSIPGVEAITGSLAHGLGTLAGRALRAKMDSLNYNCIALISDGECYEGSTWEHALFAAKQHEGSYAGHIGLDNLVAVVDHNNCIITDTISHCVELAPLKNKWESFGWYAQEINGHSYSQIMQAFQNINSNSEGRPSVIIARTIKGKGIPFMENRPDWHNKRPNDEQIRIAQEALQTNCIDSYETL